jgi:hypothetical protein
VHSMDGMKPSVHGQWPKREGHENARPARPAGQRRRRESRRHTWRQWAEGCLRDMRRSLGHGPVAPKPSKFGRDQAAFTMRGNCARTLAEKSDLASENLRAFKRL